ncbi:succinyl-diaminopimelate desuccinylase [Cucumibacter marinus]|uniref:succinyl-diaminopimelate desuccinylase n=1 Tax=Cucumibacter marinus TaxID=1121252 RepID=UPI00040498D0|nr:succinyl-diaminopimelate desuccinylase [Cucumibacter marinus]
MAQKQGNQGEVAVSLLKDLIRCPTVTPDAGSALDVTQRFLEGLGFTCTRLTFEGDGSYPVDNLFATRGSGGKHLLFCGHVDVVPPGDEGAWTHPPFSAEEADGTIWGRGAVDMKSGVAAFCAALADIPEGAGTISLAITGDEEADGINGVKKLMQWADTQGHRFDFCLVGEPSSVAEMGDMMKIGRRGSLSAIVTVTGVQGHVAYPDRARNPLPLLARIADALDAAELDQGTTHFPPTNLELVSIDTGNTASNIIPASGTLQFNIRFNDTWTPDSLAEWIRAEIAAVPADECEVSITIKPGTSPVFLSADAPAIDMLANAVTRGTGREPVRSTTGGTSDGRYIAPYCPVAEFGLVGATMHKVDERVPVAEVVTLTGIYTDFTRTFLSDERA